MLAVLLMLTGIGDSAPTQRYQIVEFGSLPQGTSFVIRGFNDAGQLVGGSISFGVGNRGFRLTTARLEQIEGLPGTDYSTAFGINVDGDVVGASNSLTSLRAFRWTPNTGSQDLGTLPGDTGSAAFGVNRGGVIAGFSSGENGVRAVTWSKDGTIRNLGVLPGGQYSRAFAINERDDVAGTSGSPSGTRAVVWRTRWPCQPSARPRSALSRPCCRPVESPPAWRSTVKGARAARARFGTSECPYRYDWRGETRTR